jgi:GT2 family glycosyltransferase
MFIPARARSFVGLQRASLLRWNAVDHDPHLIYRLLGPLRPRHLILMAEGASERIEPVVYLDTGEGFSDAESVTFRACGRAICWLEIENMPELRRVRFDPSAAPGPLKILALVTPSRFLARKLVRWLDSDVPGLGATRALRLSTTRVDDEGLGSGRDMRRYRNTAEHYADVLAMAAGRRPVPVPQQPLIAFLVPVYNTDPTHLDTLLRSFLAQPPGLSELILSDDGSSSPRTLEWLEAHGKTPGLKVVLGERNQGIAAATNRALQQAVAQWISLADHDDALSQGAVAEIARALEARPEAEFLYTDEVIAEGRLKPIGYMLKPAYDPVLLSGVNYINHLSVYRRDRLVAIGGFREGFQGSQDYDLLLRYLERVEPAKVLHLPYPAYLWRRHETSFSTEFKPVAVKSARRALAERFGEPGKPAPVDDALLPELHRVRFDLMIRTWPKVSVIIPNRDSPELMKTVLGGLAQTDYPDIEIIVADNDTADLATLALYKECGEGPLPFVIEAVPGTFNFSRSVNRGVARATGELLLLLNNDVEMQDETWLKEMVSCFRYERTGIVGARLLYPDRTLQHGGVIVGLGGLAGHWFGGKSDTFWGPMGRLAVRQSLSAVTGAAMLISRTCLDAVGPFDEEDFAIAYNDIDFCLRAGEKGFRVIWTPFATLIHHESVSRGSDEAPEKVERFRREQNNLRQRHATHTFSDPAYNPWHDTRGSVPGLRALDELPHPR